jgi:hypothetical protein
MKVIAAITADFDRTFLGLPSRLEHDLRGETVLRRTIRQARRAAGVHSVHLLVHAAQQARARAAVADLDVAVETHDAAPPPWLGYVGAARKWSLDGWRGGLAGTTVYDEFAHPWLLEALARRERADAVIDVPAAAPLLDPLLLDRLLRHYEGVRGEARVAIVQTAPGLSPIVYQPEMLANVAASGQPPGRAMSYRPENPQNDPIHQPCTCPTEAAISHGIGRCIADTASALGRLERMLAEPGIGDPERTPDAMWVSRRLLADRYPAWESLPRELEIEVTTRDPLDRSTLRPRGAALGRQADMPLDLFRRVVDDLAVCDDRLLVLGGFGEPLLHPHWPDMIRYARQRGVLGLAVRTTGVPLDEAAGHALLEAPADVLNVLLDAGTAATYRLFHDSDHYEAVLANIDRFCAVQHQRQGPRPLIVCEMVKTHETMDEMEAFYDRWIRKTGSAVIAGPSSYGGAYPDRAVVNMAPPTRSPCPRPFHRAMVLADGRVTLCDQDFRGVQAVGSIVDSGLAAIWQGSAAADARRRHLERCLDSLPVCRACNEWHRP